MSPSESYAVIDVEKAPFATVAVALRLRLTVEAVVAMGAVKRACRNRNVTDRPDGAEHPSGRRPALQRFAGGRFQRARGVHLEVAATRVLGGIIRTLDDEKSVALDRRIQRPGGGLNRALRELGERNRTADAAPHLGLPAPPSDCVTRSENETTVSLKPGVFRFARLLPTTLMAVSSAVSAESAVENEANMIGPY